MNKNKLYVRQNDENGKCIDVFPYISGRSQCQINRGNERISINDLGQVSYQKRLKSAKRTKNWA